MAAAVLGGTISSGVSLEDLFNNAGIPNGPSNFVGFNLSFSANSQYFLTFGNRSAGEPLDS